jgi:hypothetical protein
MVRRIVEDLAVEMLVANPANTLFTSVCTLADRVGLAEGGFPGE